MKSYSIFESILFMSIPLCLTVETYCVHRPEVDFSVNFAELIRSILMQWNVSVSKILAAGETLNLDSAVAALLQYMRLILLTIQTQTTTKLFVNHDDLVTETLNGVSGMGKEGTLGERVSQNIVVDFVGKCTMQ